MLPLQHTLHHGLDGTIKHSALPLRSLRSRPCRPVHQAVSNVASIGADAKKMEKTAYKGEPAAGISLDVEALQKDIRRKAEAMVGQPDVSKLSPKEAYQV